MAQVKSILLALLRGLWTERYRVLASFLGAVTLWFLLDQKVSADEEFMVTVRVVSANESWPAGNGLFIRIPDTLSFDQAVPATIKVTVRGTRERVARLEQTLRGFKVIDEEFLGGEERVTRDLDVREAFSFPRLESLGIPTWEGSEPISLTLARRHEFNLPLTLDNLEFASDELRRDLTADFSPSFVKISGPENRGTVLQNQPDLFKLARISETMLEKGLMNQLTVPARRFHFAGDGGLLRPLKVDDEQIQIRFSRVERLVPLELKDVDVTHLIPREAWRDGADLGSPLTLSPDKVTVRLEVPEAFLQSNSTAAIRSRLNVFVDLGDMSFSVSADRLAPHVEGVPSGATVEIEPREIDVVWNIK